MLELREQNASMTCRQTAYCQYSRHFLSTVKHFNPHPSPAVRPIRPLNMAPLLTGLLMRPVVREAEDEASSLYEGEKDAWPSNTRKSEAKNYGKAEICI